MAAFSSVAALTLGALGLGMSAYSMNKNKPKDIPAPTPPKDTDAEDMAKADVKRKRALANRSQSIFTSPLGISDQANVAKKRLLGQ